MVAWLRKSGKQTILPFAPEAFQPPVPQDPKLVQTSSPTKTMTLEPTTKPALGKESLGGASSSTQVGKPRPFFVSAYSYLPYPFFLRVPVSFPFLGQTNAQSAPKGHPFLGVRGF